jgi:hypothetical protein
VVGGKDQIPGFEDSKITCGPIVQRIIRQGDQARLHLRLLALQNEEWDSQEQSEKPDPD